MIKSTCIKTISAKSSLHVWRRAIASAIAPIGVIAVCVEPSSATELEPTIGLPTPVAIEISEPLPPISPDPAIASTPQPVFLSILNPSFEEDIIVSSGGAVDYITGWQILSSSPWSVGTYRPDSRSYAAHVPDGVNVAYANSGSLFQRLTSSLTANTQYTLGVDIGSRPPYGLSGYQIDLLAGETVIATTSAPIPEFGKFISAELVYAASDIDPLLGQPLAIRLTSAGIQANFDNVRLASLLLTPPSRTGEQTEVTSLTELAEDTTLTKQVAAPEDIIALDSSSELVLEPTAELDAVEPDVVFAARMLAATSDVREFTTTAAIASDADPQSVPEPTSVIGLLLGAVALTRLKRPPSKS